MLVSATDIKLTPSAFDDDVLSVLTNPSTTRGWSVTFTAICGNSTLVLALNIPVIRTNNDPEAAAVNAVVLNAPRVIVCEPLIAVLTTVVLTSSTLPLSFWITDPDANELAAGILYQPRSTLSVVLSITSAMAATSRLATT